MLRNLLGKKLPKTYSTARAAAIAGLLEAMPLARRNGWEYAGVVYRIAESGRFYVGRIHTSRQQHYVTTKVVHTPERPFVGHFHVHTGEPDWQTMDRKTVDTKALFSQTDIQSAVESGGLSWLGVAHSGDIFEIDGSSMENLLASIPVQAVGYDSEDKVTIAAGGTQIHAGQQEELAAVA